MKHLLISALALILLNGCFGTGRGTSKYIVSTQGMPHYTSTYNSDGYTPHSKVEVEMAPNCVLCKNDNPCNPHLCTHLCYPTGYAGGYSGMGPTPAQGALLMTPGAFVNTTPPVAAAPPPLLVMVGGKCVLPPSAAPASTNPPAPTTASSQFVTKEEYTGDMKLVSKSLDCLRKKQKGIIDPKCGK